MPAIEPPMGTRALAVTAAGAAMLMILTGCGVIRDLQGTREHPEPEPVSEETEDPRAEAETDFPYTRQGPVFQDTGQDSTLRFSITNMERTDDYIVMHYESTYVDHFEGINHNLGLSPTIVDPISGQTALPLYDSDDMAYGSVSPRDDGLYPVEVDATNAYRLYFPRMPDEVKQITFIGSGLGAMTGIPIVDVDEEEPDPTDPNGADMDERGPQPQAGDHIEFENRRPEADWYEYNGGLESFVDSDTTSTTRDGDTETVALKADVMFEFDDSDLTEEAEEIVREAATSVERNIDPDNLELTVVGHTDGRGSDSHNQSLSEERAETVRDVLEEELGGDYTFELEGRAAEEPVAEEGGSDDEEARARNRRVEFSYPVDPAETDDQSSEREDGVLGSSDRNVFPPAEFVEDVSTEVVATETYEDIELQVHPLRRDGAYVISSVSLTNTSSDPLTPDLTGEDGVVPGAPDDFTDGTLGGFQLLEPDSDLVRYITYFDYGQDMVGAFADEVHELQPDNTYQLISVFSAPPSEVTEMTLRAGPFGEIENVPFDG